MWVFTLFGFLIVFFLGYKVGRKYGDFHDLMLARRVSALTKQAEKLADYERDWNDAVKSGRPVRFRKAVVKSGDSK